MLPFSITIHSSSTMDRYNVLTLVALLSTAAASNSCRSDDPTPLEQLPPATQEGLNTLGCLVNGKAWLPDGSDGNHGSNFSVSYGSVTSPNGSGGSFDLRTYRYTRDTDQYMNISLNDLQVGVYPITDTVNTRVWLEDGKTGCYYESRRYTTYRAGNITITKIDTRKGIIAGTFEFTLVVPGCDTLRVTDGRFDKGI